MTGTAASAALRQRISDVLMSDTCQRIDYRWGPYHIDGWSYTAVALSLIGAHHGLHLTVAHMPPNTGAEYDPDTNAIKLPRANFAAATINGATNPSLGWERLSVVHECTHAAVDQMRRHHHILYRSNEVLAYVGGALFNVYEGSPFAAATSGGIWAAADRIAQNIKDRPGDIIGTHADVQALETAITQSATYNFLQSRPRTMVRNSGLPL